MENSRTVHNSDMEKKLGKLKKWMETGKDKKALMGGEGGTSMSGSEKR